jgi:hypothetical protein
MNLFGKKKAAPKPELKDSIGKLKTAHEQLEKRQTHLEIQIQKAHDAAKAKMRKKDTRGAKYELRKKKMLEKQLEQNYGKQMNLETQMQALEGAASDREVLNAMRDGANALQAAIKPSDVERVDDIMDDINESMAMADELGEAMSQNIGQQIDDDELLGELEEMEQEMADEDMLSMGAPEVPTRQVSEPGVAEPATKTESKQQSKVKSEDAELAELEAMMDM